MLVEGPCLSSGNDVSYFPIVENCIIPVNSTPASEFTASFVDQKILRENSSIYLMVTQVSPPTPTSLRAISPFTVCPFGTSCYRPAMAMVTSPNMMIPQLALIEWKVPLLSAHSDLLFSFADDLTYCAKILNFHAHELQYQSQSLELEATKLRHAKDAPLEILSLEALLATITPEIALADETVNAKEHVRERLVQLTKTLNAYSRRSSDRLESNKLPLNFSSQPAYLPQLSPGISQSTTIGGISTAR